MTPNFRFNKSLTKKLISSRTTDKLSIQTVKWHLENDEYKTYGSYIDTLFGTYIFIIQNRGDGDYRLNVLTKKGLHAIYIIEDIDLYLETIGAGTLSFRESQTIDKAMEELKSASPSGILRIDETDKKIYLYDHENY